MARARRLAGRPVAESILEEVRARVEALAVPPRLAFVRVGEDPASVSYVRSKERLADRAGISSVLLELPEEVDQARLLGEIHELNADEGVDGILVQLPLPGHLDGGAVLEAIDPGKDVDGFHPCNVGRLWSGQEALYPCTPAGLLEILDHYSIPVEGAHAVVVGRSNLVGKPAAALLLRRNATVTLAHSRTRELAEVTRKGDILVAAAGRPGLIDAGMVKPGAAVLDVGITRQDGKLVGDVADDVWEVAGGVTPMPGGTGPVTVAMVIRNTLSAALARRGALE